MKNKKKIIINCTLLVITALFFCVSAKAEVTGISPPEISLPAVINNSGIKQTINVSTDSNVKEDLKYTVSFRGDFSAFLNGPEELIIPAGKNSADYEFQVKPVNAANGDYETKITFLRQASSDSSGDGSKAAVKVITGATAVVRFTVSDEQVLKYEIKSFEAYDTEVGQPITASYSVANDGNVTWKPDKIDIVFHEENNIDVDKTISITDDIPISEPGGISGNKLKFQHNLIAGDYTAKALFYYQGKVVAEKASQKLKVFQEGTLKMSGEFLTFATNKQEYLPGEKIKLNATFQNTCDLDYTCFLTAEIYNKTDNSLIDLVRGKDMECVRGEEIDLSEILDISQTGDISLSGYVTYGEKKTASKTAEFSIKKIEKWWQKQWVSIAFIVLLAIILVIGAIIYKKRKKTKTAKKK